MGLRTVNDRIPRGERAFIMASNLMALQEGETPVQIRHFAKKEGV